MSARFHVSKNRLNGSLNDTPLQKLLSSCAKHLITGTVTVETPLATGRIVLRAGGVFDASYMGLQDHAAVLQMNKLRDGSYELAQRIPNLDGGMGSAAECRGDITQYSVIDIMRHCEDQALSCTITVIREFDRAEIVYRAGDIQRILFNGSIDEDKLVDVVKWTKGKFRVSVPPLALDIDGWPTTGRDPTMPFNIADVAKTLPPKRGKRPPRIATAPVITPAPVMPPPIPHAALRETSAPTLFAAARRRAPSETAITIPASRALSDSGVTAAIAARMRTSPSVPVLPVVVRSDPSGQLSMRAPTFADNSSRATPALGVLMVLVFAGLFGAWLAVAMMIGAI